MSTKDGGFPQLPPPETAEEIRASCEQHGEHYARLFEAASFITGLVAEVADEDTLVSRLPEGGPMAHYVWETGIATDRLFDRATAQYGARTRAILAGSKTAEVNGLANDLSNDFLADLGRPADMNDVQSAALYYSMATALNVRNGHKEVAPDFESSVVNQFTNTLLAKLDYSQICRTYANNLRREDAKPYALNAVRPIQNLFEQMTGQHIQETFLVSKILSFWFNTANVLAMHNMRQLMSETGVTSGELREQRHDNDLLASLIPKIRNYGISPLAFDFTKVISGHDVVFHEFKELGEPVRGEQPMAFVRVVCTEFEDESKLALRVSKEDAVGETVRRLEVEGGGGLLSLDKRGEIFAGLGISTNAIPLRILFEHAGEQGKYEALREALLGRLFDAIAPAKVVNRLASSQGTGRERQPRPPEHEPSTNKAGRRLLPRIQYLKNQNKKRLRQEFDEALREEREENARIVTLRPVAPFLRNLPQGARASDAAIERAKAEYGADFEMPEGKTFNKGYDLPTFSTRKAIGHIARYAAGYKPGDQAAEALRRAKGQS